MYIYDRLQSNDCLQFYNESETVRDRTHENIIPVMSVQQRPRTLAKAIHEGVEQAMGCTKNNYDDDLCCCLFRFALAMTDINVCYQNTA